MPAVAVGDTRYDLSEVLGSDRLDALFSDAWTGSRVWNASIFLSNHLVRLHEEGRFLGGSPASVVELGSGCGLVGLVARDLGAAQVVVTDQAEIVDLLKMNISQNTTATSGRGHVRAVEFTWGSPSYETLWVDNAPFQYILVSDCINPIYGTESWRNLARSIRDLGNASTVCYLTYEERGDNAALADFHTFSHDFLAHELLLQEGNIHLYKITQKVHGATGAAWSA
ncbi:hypothetical protein H310_14873 [Aphanomyces invadans]|uniref:Methyltransferase small domain-containing protein n=1 Tax=Aphanomyces invadans TaxID=157072 RepID=A0A024T8B7_9STRA|nr:hypothetical protein H310_14873 [Aphanomyces invadans]ETV90330.1 hypothetical protein H310_14873 [Aphanomyces invadans]|eukprot:XP_008881057.1 hypothetical protein H310_14873 [Aphanomyces invadans]